MVGSATMRIRLPSCTITTLRHRTARIHHRLRSTSSPSTPYLLGQLGSRSPHFMNLCSAFKFAFLRSNSRRKESRFHDGTEVLWMARSYFGVALGRGSVIYIRGSCVRSGSLASSGER